jgi:hypothetical protein
MSPEQAADEHDRPGQRVDNLGATLSCLLTGRAPFEGTLTVLPRVTQSDFPPPREVDPTISPAPEERYVSHRDLADAIEHWVAEEPIAAYRAVVASYESLVREHPGASDDREGLAYGRMDLGGVLHRRTHRVVDRLCRPRRRRPQPSLDLREHLLDRRQIGAGRRQRHQNRPGPLDRTTRHGGLVRLQGVPDRHNPQLAVAGPMPARLYTEQAKLSSSWFCRLFRF